MMRMIPSQSDDGEEEEEEEEVPIEFVNDDPRDMTYGRRIALALMKHAWYYPRREEEDIVIDEAIQYQQQQEQVNGDNTAGNGESEKPSAAEAAGRSFAASIRPTSPPNVTELEHPNLEKAWAYFDHVTLPRYLLVKEEKKKKNIILRCVRRIFCKGNQQLQRAEPGEDHYVTRLYSPLWTPLKQMGDFGLGIGLYFSTLRAMMLLTFLAGLINIPNFIYFSGPKYSNNQIGLKANLLKGSAICTNQVWVPCPECSTNGSQIELNRLATGTIIGAGGASATLIFALQNDCDGATLQQGFVNYGTVAAFMAGILVLNWYLQRMEVKFDEDEQTAQDYSVVITNPPPDATDPEEWRQFFQEQFDNCHVTVCTVAVDNDLLVRTLVERRERLKKIEMLVDPGTSLDIVSLSNIAAKTERGRKWWGHLLALLVPGIPELFGRVVVLTAKVQGLAQQEYPASNVFVSFETEEAQRQVLAALSIGALAVRRNDSGVLADAKYMFRGQRVLSVQEPEEPNTIRWEDLNAPYFERCKQVFWTTVATIGAIAVIALIINICNKASTVFSAFAISIFNSIFPIFAKILTSLEAHASEGHKQTSLYFKIALFRWVNTAIVLTIIRPFTATLDRTDGIIPSIYAQFFAEIVTTNVIQLADPVGHLQRHFLAPRAKTQDAMNLNMQGAGFELAERYTNMTKLLFLALWYCAIYPGTFFLCSFALLLNYFVDRFSMFRTWKRSPHLGTTISQFSRNYFFSLAVVAMAVISSYYWSAFPFDNLCPNNNEQLPSNSSYANLYQQEVALTVFNSKIPHRNRTIQTDLTYRYCLQDLIRTKQRGTFPFISAAQPSDNKWMTPHQEILTNVFGWSSVGVMVVVIASFLYVWLGSFRSLFRGTYKPCGDDQGIHFSDVSSMNTYIPQVESAVFSYPLLATTIRGLDAGLLEWTDPDRPHEFYDLTKDAEKLLRGTDISSKVVFSQVKHWPPPTRNKSKLGVPMS